MRHAPYLAINFKSFFTLIAISGAVMMFLYIWQVNLFVGSRALYDVYFKRIQEFNLQNKELEIKLANFESLKNLKERDDGLVSFENVSDVSYIKILEGVVARPYEQPASP